MRRMLGVGDGEGGLAVGQLGVATLTGFALWYMKAGGRRVSRQRQHVKAARLESSL